MIQCQGCTCAGWLWEGEGGLGDHQPGVYVPLKALFLVGKHTNGNTCGGGTNAHLQPLQCT